MSILLGKNILVIGDENTQIHDLVVALKNEGAIIHTTECGASTVENIEAAKIDFIFLNHLHEGLACENLLNSLRNSRIAKVLPIFTLVEDSPQKIEHALMLGAADYVASSEPVSDIVTKIKIIFGEANNFEGANIIDITPSIQSAALTTGKKVLVIEDDPLLRNLLALKLEKSGYIFTFATDGTSALNKAQDFQPDIIILDLMLPGIDGFEVLQLLKNDNALKAVPVIVFTNSGVNDCEKRALELGASAFFVKAMTELTDLIKTIEELNSKPLSTTTS